MSNQFNQNQLSNTAPDSIEALVRNFVEDNGTEVIQHSENFYQGWLESDLSEGIPPIQRSNSYVTHKNITNFLSTLIQLHPNSCQRP